MYNSIAKKSIAKQSIVKYLSEKMKIKKKNIITNAYHVRVPSAESTAPVGFARQGEKVRCKKTHENMWFFFGWLLDYPTSRLQFSWMNVKMERMVTKNARFFVQENKEYWFDGKYLNCFRWVLDEESALELIDLKIKIWLKIFKKQINYFYQLFRSQNMPSTFQITIFNTQFFI